MIEPLVAIRTVNHLVQPPKNNPYRLKVFDHPGRLFTSDDAEDAEAIRELSAGEDIICEVGSGSGGHLIELGRRNPSAKIFGFELRFKRSVRTIEKAKELAVPNVYVIRKRAENITRFFEPHSIKGVFVNFPDPWAKRRRQKNRVMSEEFVTEIVGLLKPGGYLSFKTDHKGYFESVSAQMNARKDLDVTESSTNLHCSEYLDANIITEFERLFLRQGLPIHYLKALTKS